MLKIVKKIRGVQAFLAFSSTPSMNLKLVCRETPGNTMKVRVNTKVILTRNYQEIRKLLFVMIRKAMNLET